MLKPIIAFYDTKRRTSECSDPPKAHAPPAQGPTAGSVIDFASICLHACMHISIYIYIIYIYIKYTCMHYMDE